MIAKKDKVHGKSFVVFGGDVQMVNSLERMLLFAGANVQAATTAYKGVSHTLNLRPDIVIFEDTISDLEPVKVIESLQADDLTKDIPVIVITSKPEAEPYKEFFKSGLQDYVAHDQFDMMQMVLKIEAILHKVSPSEKSASIYINEDAAEALPADIKDVRLLVIEDDPLLRNLLSIRLQKSGIEHQFWNSGSDAVAGILEYKPTIIILDLMLPGKHGMDVLSDMRDIPSVSDTPVIIFSNKDDDEERSRAKTLNVKDFMVKATTDLSDLITLILKRSKH
jgi:DNA-binding response OmpR family regulator